MPGPAPKPASKRRRHDKPKSYGAAEPIIAAAAAAGAVRELGFDAPHPLVASLWDTAASSCEAAFYSDSDWVRLRLELWNMDREMKADRPSAAAWATIQHGLNELLLSPAIKRRAGIEVRPVEDTDEVEAVAMTARYHKMLKSVSTL